MRRSTCFVLCLAAMLALVPGPTTGSDCGTSIEIVDVTVTEYAVQITLRNLLDEGMSATVIVSGQMGGEPFTTGYPVTLEPQETRQITLSFPRPISDIEVTLANCGGTTESPDPVVPVKHGR